MPRHRSPILHSFVDPPLNRSKNNPVNLSPSALYLPHLSSSSSTAPAFPLARAHLAPAARGFWLIPISGALPYPEAALPTWNLAPAGRDPRATRIYWTDARLAMLWMRLGQYGQLGQFGPLDVLAHVATSGGGWPDHIRVGMDAEYALAFRVALALVRAAGEGDDVKFLHEARLIWVSDEGRRPVLVA